MEEIWSLDAFRKVRIWINEYPNVKQSEKSTYEIKYQGDKRINWFNGIMCVELFIAPRAASNYAMLNMEFVKNDSNEFAIIYNINKSDGLKFESKVASTNDEVLEGISKEYLDCFTELCNKMTDYKLPSGILNISGGACGKIGTSAMTIRKVFDIMIKIFSSNYSDNFDDAVKDLILVECKK
ncbi:hypothetical protein acsn021_08110 [Anaerocolumna cellulosilytica]|uniref:Uncharacterized protein n=1 Tax=Anaerocolumna cellulosilytica TaxID=433286 RepID=A0A6S6R116_9FIRM|nr:hypothetical protein [Anaerocolumna cellulosilytica]MBB5198146.1 hypothetical protein [Anaerocolumna cellulosilytica]BCJ93242.1 hypothetical protein acsn021_08110 [Anaerocolumna cellulosilytica]